MENANGNKVVEFKLPVVARDKDGNELGKGTYIAFSANDEGFVRLCKKHSKKEIVETWNRQTKTDARNDLARVKSTQAQMKALEKTNEDFAREVKELRAKWKING